MQTINRAGELTTAEVAERLGVTAETIRRWKNAGYLPEPTNPAKRKFWRWDAKTIETWLQSRREHVSGSPAEYQFITGVASYLTTIASGQSPVGQVHPAVARLALLYADLLSDPRMNVAIQLKYAQKCVREIRWDIRPEDVRTPEDEAELNDCVRAAEQALANFGVPVTE